MRRYIRASEELLRKKIRVVQDRKRGFLYSLYVYLESNAGRVESAAY